MNFVFLPSKNYLWKVYYLMCPPLSPFHRNIKINLLGFVSFKLYSENIFTCLIWLTLFTTFSVTYTCHRFPIWNNVKSKVYHRGIHIYGAIRVLFCDPKIMLWYFICIGKKILVVGLGVEKPLYITRWLPWWMLKSRKSQQTGKLHYCLCYCQSTLS